MTKEQFKALASQKILILDGATGSNLMKAGMPAGVCPEEWIVNHPDALIQLQKAYVNAGSNIVYAPTFSANRIKLAEYGLENRIEELNTALVKISKDAVGDRALVAGDLTMTGQQLTPIGILDFEELITIYKEQIGYLVKAGVDLLVVETMMSLQETRAALIAAKEICPDLPVMATMTFEPVGRALFGTDAKTAAVVLASLGADAVGANCSTGPAKMAEVIRAMAEVTEIPIIAKPNAGLPSLNDAGETVYDMAAAAFGEEITMLLEAGAGILGGCCGTTPDHIKALVGAVGDHKPAARKKPEKYFLTSERKTISFGLNDPFIIVGERINPTGKKKLQEQLRNGEFDMVTEFAEEQEERGASILDINMGMSGIDEKSMMLKALEEVSLVTSLPLSIDSSHVDVIEAALRRYPGKALVNSVSMETEKIEKLLPVVKKYGAAFILLPLSDRGLPESKEEKIGIIDAILERAKLLGIPKNDIVVDGLVTTVGANPKAALETLDTIRYCKNKGLATTCGLSNISFGLPERSCVNTAFLTMAIQAGLTMAIANPSQDLLVGAAFASDMLLAKEESDIRYIEFSQKQKERREIEEEEKKRAMLRQLNAKADHSSEKEHSETTAKESVQTKANTPQDDVYQAVLKGNRKSIEALTHKALEAGTAPQILLNDYLLPAINTVGELFDRGKYFLPQLISSAEAMKLSIAILEPLLLESGGQKEMPTVVVATVEGDIHDIGKNLVVLMLKNYGFRVIDLGKDVPAGVILDEAVKHDAKIIGLSALMTTTMKQMKTVVELAKERNVSAKIIIGGAVITQEYADEIHADGYAKDAADTVRVAKKLLNLE
ncbi:MAG: homocysteine S-methyltransferase family protein [Lachnospiraceae bacterium]|nr:homocysteine S-methyltransferase family protein [Lachnospiraceae bacterium]